MKLKNIMHPGMTFTIALLFVLGSCQVSINKDHVAEGTKLMSQGDYFNADQAFDDALFIDNNNLNALRGSCLCALNLGILDKALKRANKFIELSPNTVEGYSDRGMVYLYQKNFEKALQDFNKVIELGTNYPGVAYFNKAEALRELNRFEEAIIAYNTVLASDKKDARAHYKKGMTFEKMRNMDSACSSYQIAAELGDQDAAKQITTTCR